MPKKHRSIVADIEGADLTVPIKGRARSGGVGHARGIGALADHRIEIEAGIDLLKPIAEQALVGIKRSGAE